MASSWGTSWGVSWGNSWGATVAPPVVVPATPNTGGSGGGGRGGGARWERASSNIGAKPGQLSVKEQNAKERRELQEIAEREARAEAHTEKQRAELKELKALIAKAKADAESVAAIAAALTVAEKIENERLTALSAEMVEKKPEAEQYESEALILLLMAA